MWLLLVIVVTGPDDNGVSITLEKLRYRSACEEVARDIEAEMSDFWVFTKCYEGE